MLDDGLHFFKRTAADQFRAHVESQDDNVITADFRNGLYGLMKGRMVLLTTTEPDQVDAVADWFLSAAEKARAGNLDFEALGTAQVLRQVGEQLHKDADLWRRGQYPFC